MRLIVAGSRGFCDPELMRKWLDKAYKQHKDDLIIVSGTADGADKLGEEYAEYREIRCFKYPAQWKKHGKKAGVLRNHQMANNADALIVFWDGESRGTKHMISAAEMLGLPTKIVKYRE